MKNIPVRKINATTKEPDFLGSFTIRNVRHLLLGKDMWQELHRHDFFFLLVLEKGAGNHEIDFIPYKITGRSVFFLRPGQVHQLKLKAGSTGYLMGFRTGFYENDKIFNQLLRKAGNWNHYKPDVSSFKRLLVLVNYIFQEYSHKQESYAEVIKANLTIFFIELVRQNSKNVSRNVNIYAQERLDEFLSLLESNVSTDKQVSQYADKLHLSGYQLNAMTKAMLGKTCSELISEYIILESKRYLLATSNQVNQIAYHLGYEDVSYFIRFFKKHTGYTPEAFRHNFK
jgi:AraC family transcriptional activator of pobA